MSEFDIDPPHGSDGRARPIVASSFARMLLMWFLTVCSTILRFVAI
jgi:hypothetical protein